MKPRKVICAYCNDSGECPTCRGAGYFTIKQKTPPYTYESACLDCNGEKSCQACAVRAERRLIDRNGTL